MQKIITTIKNVFSIKELRERILYTLFFLAVFRLGSYIVLPGIDPELLNANQGGLFGFLNAFLGGAFSRASIFALGIMPYITASIVIQLLQVAWPKFQKMQREGESGQRKINQITRSLTILITTFQSTAYLSVTVPAEAIQTNIVFFNIYSTVILTAGTICCMWLGERITEKGVGNGISMLIMIGIISNFPVAFMEEASSKIASGSLIWFILELVALFFVVMATILLVQAVRRIPVRYARQNMGGSRYHTNKQSESSYIPLKVNAANVMPIIFAQSLMFAPSMIAGVFANESDTARYIATAFADYTSWQYSLLFAILIIVFTFFYTAITIDTKQITRDLKNNNGFIPGIQPGKPTDNYISRILDLITAPGALMLAFVAIFPTFANMAEVGLNFAQFYGGTSLIIIVGVVLDTLQQIEGYLLNLHYEGLMGGSGKVRSRRAA